LPRRSDERYWRDAVIDKVERGEFANENDVIVRSVQALVDEKAEIDQWLRQSVAPTYDKVVAGQAISSASDVLDRLKSHMLSLKFA